MPAHADARDRAKRMYDRLVGVPPSEAQLADMAARIGANPTHAQLFDAAMVAIRSPDFYNVALVGFITPWTNAEQTVFADLNDYTATVIGMIRDVTLSRSTRCSAPISSTSPRRVWCRPPIRRRATSTTSRSSSKASISRIRRSSSACRSRCSRAPRSAQRTPRGS